MKSLRYLFVFFLVATTLCIAAYLAAAPYAVLPFFNALLMLAAPLALAIYLYRRLGADWRVFGLGVLSFLGSQLLHIPFNSWTLLPALKNLGLDPQGPLSGPELAVFALAVGLSSGLFEETARYIIFSRWMEKARAWKDGLMFGAGHGGAEAILTGVMALLYFLFALSARNADPGSITPDQQQAVQEFSAAYWGLPWYIYILPLFERLSALAFHLFASLLVLRAVERRTFSWFWAAVLLHTAFNATALFALATWGELASEGLIFLLGSLCLGLLLRMRPRGDALPSPGASRRKPPASAARPPAPPTSEKLEDTRYD